MKHGYRSLRRARLGTEGQTMTEFALVIPVFLVVVFAMMYFAEAVYAYSYVSYAAREATRYAAVRGSASLTPATASAVQNFVYGETAALDTKLLTVATSWTPDNNPGSVVKVQVQYNFPLSVPFLTSTTLTLASASQMVISQ